MTPMVIAGCHRNEPSGMCDVLWKPRDVDLAWKRQIGVDTLFPVLSCRATVDNRQANYFRKN